MTDGRLIESQDVEIGENGRRRGVLQYARTHKGVTPNRRIAIEDPAMRHGRKSRSQKFNGYKRHILKDLNLGMIIPINYEIALNLRLIC